MPQLVKPGIFSILFLFFLATYGSYTPDPYTTLLTVVIMVKDEADVLESTLKPFIDAGIDSFLVYDTGSTDGTQQKALECFKKYHLDHAYIAEEPFIDFATSRNRALDIAEEIFSDSTFFLMLDAEWYTYNVAGLINYCKYYQQHIDPGTTGSCYAIRLVTIQDNMDNYATRLFRREKGARYVGVVHESVQQSPSNRLPKDIYFTYAPQEYGREKSQKRCLRDYQLLKKSLENDPSNTRTLFYLAQTCQFLDKWEEAIEYYRQRSEVGAISEERYLALYRIGCAIEQIMYNCYRDNQACSYCWQDALFYYLKAHTMLPHRAEPLIRIAHYYLRNKEYAVSYIFAHRAAQLPYPHNDILFVEKAAYDYLRYDILGQVALYVGALEEGSKAVRQALTIYPELEHLHHNLSVYNRYLVAT
jgi:glycosyltransferase involved in cell wall biosynthesis